MKLKRNKMTGEGKRTALIDADGIVYRIGFACQEEESLAAVLHSTKTFLNEILEVTDADSYRLYLTGSNNFRKSIAVTKEYKAGRGEKPKWYNDIREYMIGVWKATVREEDEADDALAIDCWASPDTTIICTQDKDLDMIPGEHYDFVKQRTTIIDAVTARQCFYTQLLTGDTVDCIPGLKGIGKKKAEKILAGLETTEDIELAVCSAYCDIVGENWLWYLHEQGRLLWMRRYEGELWNICYEF